MPLRRQYSETSWALSGAVSSTAWNFWALDHLRPSPRLSSPAAIASLRQVLSVTAVIPLCLASSTTVRFNGGDICSMTHRFCSAEGLAQKKVTKEKSLTFGWRGVDRRASLRPVSSSTCST
jgi:hypothetical protein